MPGVFPMNTADFVVGAFLGVGVTCVVWWGSNALKVRLPTRGEIENPREVILDIEDDRVTKVEYKA